LDFLETNGRTFSDEKASAKKIVVPEAGLKGGLLPLLYDRQKDKFTLPSQGLGSLNMAEQNLYF
jgi:hypothetical protein